MNRFGTPENLVASHPQNRSREVHGVYSARRELTPEVREIAESLMELPHVASADAAAAIEIGKLTVLVDRIDQALADGHVENRRGQLRSLVDQRRKLSRELRDWYAAFGLTPLGRAEWASRLARPSLGEVVERRMREIEAETEVEEAS